ncbi:MAG: glutamate racemase [Bacteroidia bacterium]|nr:glutamate racemase [Bacteroidia bacterium]
MSIVGLFDSGLGGLLTARLLREKRPDLTILYYGDTAHLPYGDKSPLQIRGYVRDIVHFLKDQGAEYIAIACNTASSVAYETACEAAKGAPVFSAIFPALSAFERERFPEPIGVIGTHTTIESGIYGSALRAANYTVRELATPVLVPLIEEGWILHPATKAALDTYLSELGTVQTLLLACTHYPLIEPVIAEYYQSRRLSVRIISTAELLAKEIAEKVPSTGEGKGDWRFWVSDANPRFLQLAQRFWGAPILSETPSGAGAVR